MSDARSPRAKMSPLSIVLCGECCVVDTTEPDSSKRAIHGRPDLPCTPLRRNAPIPSKRLAAEVLAMTRGRADMPVR